MNDRLVELVAAWKANGSQTQPGFNWASNWPNWIKAFPLDLDFITSPPLNLDRKQVREICETSGYSIREKFLSVMIWGYGDRGYGPYRVTQMLNQSHAEQVLSEVYELSCLGNAKGAYDFLRLNRIHTLGPSYGSKFISFCTPRKFGAPIYDSYIASWIKSLASQDFIGIPISAENWNSKTYFRYLDWVSEHATELNCFPDEIELVLFSDAEKMFSKSSK